MSYISPPSRPGMTAIAAALALSSTPLFAQDAAPVDAAPVVMVTPPPVTSAPASSSIATSVPVLNVAPPAIVAAPRVAPVAPAPVITRAEQPVTRSSPIQRAARPAAPVATPAAAAPVTRTAAPIDVTPVSAPTPVAEAPAPAAVPAAPRVAQADTDNDVLPLAGGLAAMVVLMGGALFALNRPRRRDEEEDDVIVAETVPAPIAPARFAPPLAATARGPAIEPTGPTTAIPAGFDVTRFGRHTQAAYRGPTPDNPFLSLKSRLKRASFFDGRERMAAEMGQQPAARTDTWMPEARPAPGRQPEYVTTRINQPPRPGFRPAFS